jgi:hypothetical protein
MTTIAFDGATLASDSRSTGSYIDDKTKKIFKQGNRYYGIAGRYTSALLFLQWSNDRTKEKPRLEDDFDVIEIDKGKAFYYDKNLVKTPTSVPCSIGSGCHIAMTAMLLKHSSIEAVRVAKKLDECTGGKIQSVKTK